MSAQRRDGDGRLAGMSGATRLGYVRDPRTDVLCFLALPAFAIAVALGFHHWLPYAAGAAISLWITIPHHYATWLRTYGQRETFSQWRGRLLLGPVLLLPMVFFASATLPLTLALIVLLWDHQHSMMQQHGFARIYDAKAGAGAPSTGRFDFWLGVTLYVNMLATAPLWTELWIQDAYNWNLRIQASSVEAIQTASWTLAGSYLAVYLGHLTWSVARGYALNPMKYAFLVASYGLWYYVSWQDSLLVYLVAHRIMHGVQYIAMVYWYLERNIERTGEPPRLLKRLSVGRFVLLGIAYALLFQLVSGLPLEDFAFGLGASLRAQGVLPPSEAGPIGVWAAALSASAGVLHYYVDSFIWKVSDARTRRDL
jgi:hypothetical protein